MHRFLSNMVTWTCGLYYIQRPTLPAHIVKLTMSQEKLSTIPPCIAVIQFKQFTLHLKYINSIYRHSKGSPQRNLTTRFIYKQKGPKGCFPE